MSPQPLQDCGIRIRPARADDAMLPPPLLPLQPSSACVPHGLLAAHDVHGLTLMVHTTASQDRRWCIKTGLTREMQPSTRRIPCTTSLPPSVIPSPPPARYCPLSLPRDHKLMCGVKTYTHMRLTPSRVSHRVEGASTEDRSPH